MLNFKNESQNLKDIISKFNKKLNLELLLNKYNNSFEKLPLLVFNRIIKYLIANNYINIQSNPNYWDYYFIDTNKQINNDIYLPFIPNDNNINILNSCLENSHSDITYIYL